MMYYVTIRFEGCGVDKRTEPKDRLGAFNDALKLCDEMSEEQKFQLAEHGTVKVGESIIRIENRRNV